MVIDLGMAGDKCFVKGGVATNASGVGDTRDRLWDLGILGWNNDGNYCIL